MIGSRIILVWVGLLVGCAVASKDFDVGSDAAPGRDAGEWVGAPDAGGSDAAMSDGRTPCGMVFCRTDQKCSSGACTTPCNGANMPGDFATIQAALQALANSQAD